MEHATRRRVDRARDVAFEADPDPAVAVDRRRCRQQCLGIRMMGTVEHPLRWPELHDPSEIENGDAVRQVTHDAQVVGDEQVARPAVALEVGEQVEDCCLHRHVERRGWFIADDDARVTGERTSDRHALLQASRELHRAHIEVPFGESNRSDDLVQLGSDLVLGHLGEVAQRAGDDPAHRMSTVERRVRILEDDLNGTNLVVAPMAGSGPEHLTVAQEGAVLIRGMDAEHGVGQGRLAAAGLSDQTNGLACVQRERNVVEGVHCFAAVVESLADARKLEDRRPAAIDDN